MTSYRGLPKEQIGLVSAFQSALLRKLAEKGVRTDFEGQLESIDELYAARAKECSKGESKTRRQNWQNVCKGWAESDKLSLLFQAAQQKLSPEDIQACIPEQISQGNACISRYEMEKNGLSHMEEFLVPKSIRDFGLF